MQTLEKCFNIIDEQLKYLATKDAFGQFPNSLTDEFDKDSYEGKKALEIISNLNLIYFRGSDDQSFYSRIAEITDEGREALKVGIKKYLESLQPTRTIIGYKQ